MKSSLHLEISNFVYATLQQVCSKSFYCHFAQNYLSELNLSFYFIPSISKFCAVMKVCSEYNTDKFPKKKKLPCTHNYIFIVANVWTGFAGSCLDPFSISRTSPVASSTWYSPSAHYLSRTVYVIEHAMQWYRFKQMPFLYSSLIKA